MVSMTALFSGNVAVLYFELSELNRTLDTGTRTLVSLMSVEDQGSVLDGVRQ